MKAQFFSAHLSTILSIMSIMFAELMRVLSLLVVGVGANVYPLFQHIRGAGWAPPVVPSKSDWTVALNTFTMKSDFVVHIVPKRGATSAPPVHLLMDLEASYGWLHSAPTAYPYPSACASVKDLAGEALTLCESADERLDAGKNIEWNARLWLNRGRRLGTVDGVLAASRWSGFYNNLLVVPENGRLVVAVHPQFNVAARVCKKGRMYYSAAIPGEAWRVQGIIGLTNGDATATDLILSTTSSIELSEHDFGIFRERMKQLNAELYRLPNGAPGYQVVNCASVRSFPNIGIQIGQFSISIPPEWYVSKRKGLNPNSCFIDVRPNRGNPSVNRVGLSFLRNVVTHFSDNQVGFCERR